MVVGDGSWVPGLPPWGPTVTRRERQPHDQAVLSAQSVPCDRGAGRRTAGGLGTPLPPPRGPGEETKAQGTSEQGCRKRPKTPTPYHAGGCKPRKTMAPVTGDRWRAKLSMNQRIPGGPDTPAFCAQCSLADGASICVWKCKTKQGRTTTVFTTSPHTAATHEQPGLYLPPSTQKDQPERGSIAHRTPQIPSALGLRAHQP